MSALSGPGSRRRLGTQSGATRRVARTLDGRGRSLMEFEAAKQKLGEGSAITSADENVAAADYTRRMQAGLMETQRRSLLGGGQNTPRTTGRTPVDAAEGSTLTPQQSRMKFYADQKAARMGTPAAAAPSLGGGERPSLTLGRSSPVQGPPAPTKPRTGLIDGRPASQVLGQDTEPGNMADLQARDADARESAITQAREESAGNAKVTRRDVIDRINKEREAQGMQPFGDDIYKSIAKQDGATTRGVTVPAPPKTPLQQALRDVSARYGQTSTPTYDQIMEGKLNAEFTDGFPAAEDGELPTPEWAKKSTLRTARESTQGIETQVSRNQVASLQPASSSPQPAKPVVGNLNVKFSGERGFANPAVAAELERQKQEKAKRVAEDKKRQGKPSTQAGLLSRFGLRKPGFLRDTIAGNVFDSINK